MAKSKQAWFVKTRGSYLPSSLMGASIYTLYVLYVVALLGDWAINGHHTWHLLTAVIPLTVGAALVTQYIASKHSR